MSTKSSQRIAEIIKEYESDVLADWVKQQLAARTSRPDLMSDQELRHQSKEFLSLFRGAVESGNLTDITSPEWTKAREFLEGISRSRAEQGFTPSETATFVFSLKQPLFTRLQKKLAKDVKALGEDTWTATVVLDRLGLYAMEVHQQRREAVIGRQQQDLLEALERHPGSAPDRHP
jgi:rsbT co-antagonist protein RsbR